MYSIQEVCKKSGLSSRTLRVWESLGLLESSRNSGGVRIYDDKVFDSIHVITNYKKYGLDLKSMIGLIDGEEKELSKELVQLKRMQLESETPENMGKLRNLAKTEEFLDLGEKFSLSGVLLQNSDNMKQDIIEFLLQKRIVSHEKIYRDYLNHELTDLNPEEILIWVEATRKLKLLVKEHNIQGLCFRGYAASSIFYWLMGLSDHDPVKENLFPTCPKLQACHFDVPYFTDKQFFVELKKINLSLSGISLAAFRLPFLDIFAEYSKKTGFDLQNIQSDCDAVQFLRKAGSSYIYGLDKSGQTLVEKIYPSLSFELRATERVDADLSDFGIFSKEDVLKFLALRQKGSWSVFENVQQSRFSPNITQASESELFWSSNPTSIFREDLLHKIHSTLQLKYSDAILCLREIRNSKSINLEKPEYQALNDKPWVNNLLQDSQTVFHKAHLVGLWKYIKIGLSAKRYNETEWIKCLKNWEEKNGLAWNDFGIDWKHVKLFMD